MASLDSQDQDLFRVRFYEFFAVVKTLDRLIGVSKTDAILESLDLSRNSQNFPQSPVYELLLARIIRRAEKSFNLRGLPFTIAEEISLPELGILGHAVLTTETLGKAIEVSMKYSSRVGRARYTNIVKDGESILVHFVLRAGDLAEQTTYKELWSAVSWHFIRQSCSKIKQDASFEVYFDYAAPANVLTYEKFFKAPVHFGQSQTAFCFSTDSLSLPMEAANSVASDVLTKQFQRLRKQVGRTEGIVDVVRQELLQSKGGDWTNIDQVARQLGLSGRTLRRRLLAEGSSFKRISNEMRMTMARDYVLHTNISNDEIAFLLGYTAVPSFFRAFRSWHGLSPAEMRAKEA